MIIEKTAIITGGSRGIGKSVAIKFAEMGINTAIIYSNDSTGAENVKEICESYGANSEIFKCDVSNYSDVEETVNQIMKYFGKIDILINNAGIVKDNLAIVMRESEFDDVIGVNLKGSFNMIRMCLPYFIRSGGGKIINISSAVAIKGNRGQVNYSASKAGIIGMTKTIAREYAEKNITCNAIAPGYIQTSMTEALKNNELIEQIPMKKAGKTDDVADLAIFLASEAADYITGEVIRVDGGLAM